MTREAGLAHLDVYLDQVRRLLRGLSAEEVQEILAELKSHVLDKVGGDTTPAKVEAAIEALGRPRDIARVNLAERAVAQMTSKPSLMAAPRAIARLASLSLYGFFAFLVSLVGYGTGAALVITALIKPFVGDRAGLWRLADKKDDYSFSLGVMDHAPRAQELLGWWIIPVGLLAGSLALWLTWRFGVFSLRLMAGRRERAPDLAWASARPV
ncbi:MAG: DUF1700 domain-containing protein [Caulobacterales bacterium]